MGQKDNKKFKIHPKLRSGLLAILACLFFLMGFLIYRIYTIPSYITEKVPLYTYDSKADIDYRVNLLPNPIYKEESLDKGLFYLTPYVKNIAALMTYEFKGQRDFEYKGDYEAVALMQGIKRELDKVKVIWSKGYQLLPKTIIEGTGNTISLRQAVPINIKPYNDFIKKFMEDTKIATEVMLTILWKVNVEVQTDSGPVKEQLVPTMTMPLNTSYFEISGDLAKAKKGAIEKTVQKIVPPSKTKVAALGAVGGFSFLAALFLVFFTAPLESIDPLASRLKQIFKNHGERLVTMAPGAAVGQAQVIKLKSFDDLVKAADELGKPILYKYEAGSEYPPSFYVLADDHFLLFELTAESLNEPLKAAAAQRIKTQSAEKGKGEQA